MTLPGGSDRIMPSTLAVLSPVKGVMAALRAWEAMTDPPKLVILGEGSLHDTVERTAARHPAIEFRGWLHQATGACPNSPDGSWSCPRSGTEAGVPGFAAGD